ncbi:MAG: preprotein translocase subunit SecG [Arsenophonus sp. ET-DL9-MAG3]
MYIILLILFLLISIILITIIMLQQGKNSDIGGSSSISSSAILFASSGSSNFMTRMTAIFATLFFIISLLLANLTYNKNITKSKWEKIGDPIAIEKSTEVSIKPLLPTNDIPH